MAEGKALGSFNIFNPQQPSIACAVEDNKEGNDVCIGGRVRACFNIPKRFTPFPQTPNPSIACALASTPCRAEGCGQCSGIAEGKVLGGFGRGLWDLLIFLILKMPRFARYFEESKEGNDVCIGGRVKACFNIPKRFTPFPQAPNPSIACALASTPCKAEGCGQCSGIAEGNTLGMAEGEVLAWLRARLWDLLIFLILRC